MNRYALVPLLGLLLTLVIASPARAGDAFSFKKYGELVKTIPFEELANITRALPRPTWDPSEQVQTNYVGFDFKELLDSAYGRSWITTEELLFTCTNGYEQSIPVNRFLQYSSYLIYSREGGAFELVNKARENKHLKLAPYYLTWDNARDPELRVAGDAFNWPFQVNAVDLIRFKDRFSQMAPAANAPREAIAGFAHFHNFCMGCHSMNGDGGHVASDLNFPVNVTEHHDDALLRKWILDPQSARKGVAMPALFGELKDRPKAADDLIAYLKTMRANKIKPRKKMALPH